MSNLSDRLRGIRGRAVAAVAITGLAAAALLAFFVYKVNDRIAAEKEGQDAAGAVEVEAVQLRAPSTDGLTLFINAADVRAVARFNGSWFLATSGGLIELDSSDGVKRRYTSLDGLPDNDLTALAVFQGRLYAGTATAGLIAFDGNRFTGYRFKKPAAARVSALVASEGELLIGTLDGGLFEFDGERFTRRFNSATGADFSRVTSILPFRSRLYVGTQDRGLYLWREAHIERVGTGEGLPSPHVTGLAVMPGEDSGSIAVATDFGVVAIDEGNAVTRISARPNVTSLAVSAGRLWGGLFTGGIIDLTRERRERPGDAGRDAPPTGLPASAPVIVSAGEGALWALTAEGAYKRGDMSELAAMERVAPELARDRALTAGHVTGLAFDGAGRLWVGFFDGGIDVVSGEAGEPVARVEDDRVREVNFIRFDPADDRMLVATSRGLVVFDGQQKRAVLDHDQSGIASDSVAHVSVVDSAYLPVPVSQSGGAGTSRALVLATSSGLSHVMGGRARSITAFHGLASNHLYTSAMANGRLYAGSLAGLAELEGLRVIRTYKTSNSRLSHDWVTALVEIDGSLYIGTNGGGVDLLLPTGEWVNFSNELGRFEVNQNAMHFDGERLYVGTSDRGILIYNTRARRWSRFVAGLPSPSVTALASDDRSVYAGTMNGLLRIEKRALD